ncbi:Type I phosphodiesterase / nucleotide pyrophosphatase [Ekhidna lutea]|uniref:Type I phosphodiesterase / nucleotide pyrophosphatase n=1 Tax=Ekhidna lutea TaxID=447679 RepID=A0A239M735_EKHLU|nr:alkaline phosphatase PafA [Ekhidna lutea]SNT37958.1 Type I phosphodiesterase / nucleotide pyrophosphatase [Ekhidna lutea]
MKKFFFTLLLMLFFRGFSQEKPKLVVGIVVDQMRYDYISRYYSDFEDGGFKRLIEEGFLYRNAHYNYMPTKTGPGHASIFTGTTPARHGIIGNDWFVPSINRRFNCVEDTASSVVGGVSNGAVSSRNLKATTITDELRLYYNFTSKVIGVSLKDRGAALPAGHNPTGAYWYDLQSGNMITSTYYRDELPSWVDAFNKENRPSAFLSNKWELFRDEEVYNESIEDENPYEQELRKGLGVSFPHDLPKHKKDLSLLKYTPFTNTLIKEFSMKAVVEEEMGLDSIPDFLTMSFSATDDIGHRFGPRSVEVQDTYLRLDRELSEFLSFLDDTIGKNEYVVFLSADHGATDVPSYMYKNKMPGGYHNNGFIKSLLNDGLGEVFGEGKWISSIINEQIYLNHELISEKGANTDEVKQKTIEILMGEDYVYEAFDANLVAKRMFTDPLLIKLQNGYENKRSGDILYVLTPSDLNDSWGRQGTDHRSPYTYDTHIPIIFFGKGIKPGKTVRPVSITDIAPTLSMLLDISLPSMSNGQPLKELFE